MAQEKGSPPTVAIDGYNLKVVENFTYLGSILSQLSFHRCGDKWQIAKVMGQTEPKGLEQQQPYSEDQAVRLQGLCAQHTPL